MSNPIIRIHDLATDEIIDREMTDDEVKEANYVPPKVAKERAEEAKVYAEKEAARQALLAQLGITEEQAKLLLS